MDVQLKLYFRKLHGIVNTNIHLKTSLDQQYQRCRPVKHQRANKYTHSGNLQETTDLVRASGAVQVKMSVGESTT